GPRSGSGIGQRQLPYDVPDGSHVCVPAGPPSQAQSIVEYGVQIRGGSLEPHAANTHAASTNDNGDVFMPLLSPTQCHERKEPGPGEARAACAAADVAA